jgi:hypothetical protein
MKYIPGADTFMQEMIQLLSLDPEADHCDFSGCIIDHE